MSNEDFDLNDFKESVGSSTVSAKPGIGLCGAVVAEPPQTTDGEKNKPDLIQWAKCGPGEYSGIGRTITKLSSDVYTLGGRNGEIIFQKKEVNVDKLIKFPDSKSEKVIFEIENFWKKGDVFTKYGFLHKRGYLFYGPPGGGKSCLVQQIIHGIIQNGGLVFMCDNPHLLKPALKVFRQIEPNRPIVCVYEDIDTIINTYGEDALLSILDGDGQVDKCVNIATTNYPERLDKRVVNRPRRFDRVIKISMPDKKCRKVFFNEKLNITDDVELDRWVDETDGFGFAAMSELVISVKCLDKTFEESIDILRKLMDSKPSSEKSGDENDEPVKFGFFPTKKNG